jgi:hypothetical protein
MRLFLPSIHIDCSPFERQRSLAHVWWYSRADRDNAVAANRLRLSIMLPEACSECISVWDFDNHAIVVKSRQQSDHFALTVLHCSDWVYVYCTGHVEEQWWEWSRLSGFATFAKFIILKQPVALPANIVRQILGFPINSQYCLEGKSMQQIDLNSSVVSQSF